MTAEEDQLLLSLRALEEALELNDERAREMRARIARIREQRRAGRSYRELVPEEQRPLVVELLTQSAKALDSAGAQVRRIEAQVLYHEGMTMEAIAALFGVTRQRVSRLLQEGRTRSDA